MCEARSGDAQPAIEIKGAAPLETRVERTKNGAFRCEYTATRAGEYVVHASLKGQPVRWRGVA